MIDLTRHYLLLRSMYLLQRLRARLRRRDPARRKAEQHRAEFYAKLWRDAAAHFGGEFRDLGYGIFEVRVGEFVTRVHESCCGLEDPVAITIALNKSLVCKLLAAEGLPIPKNTTFTLRDIRKAVDFLEKTGECVVKPASGTGAGQGVATGIRTRSQLARAALNATQFSGELLIEQQVSGRNYRLLYLDGVLWDVVCREPPSVVGDGRATVEKLVERANAERLAHGSTRSQVVLTIDMDMHNTLAKQGLSLQSVPKSGQVITVKTVINQNFGNDNVTALESMCEEVIATGARAARCVGARLAGVDIITPDPATPLAEAGGVILEVNTTPGFHHHYLKRDGSFPVAIRVLEQLLQRHEQEAPQLSTCP